MFKRLSTEIGLAIGATLLGAGQVFAGSFTIDSFNVQFSPVPCSTTPTTANCSSNQPLAPLGTPTGVIPPNSPTLQVGSGFSPNYRTGTITQAAGLNPVQVIGGGRTMTLNQLRFNNQAATLSSGRTRLLPLGNSPTFWQIQALANSRVSASMIWDKINPNLAASDPASGKFLDRLNNSGSLAFRTGAFGQAPNPLFTFTVRDSNDRTATASRSNVGANQFVFMRFEDFQRPVGFDFNAVKYVELNVQVGSASGGSVQVDFVQGFEIPEPSLAFGSAIALGIGFVSIKSRSAKFKVDGR